MSSNKKCPNCGHSPKKGSLDEITVMNISPEPDEFDEEKLIAKIKDQVLTEVRNSVEPLLIKLKEIGDQANSNQNANPQLAHEQQLKQLHTQAMERMKAKEQNLAFRMKKLQLRTSGKASSQ